MTSIKSYFKKSSELATPKNEIITPVDSIEKIDGKAALLNYLENAYTNNIKKLKIQALEKQCQELAGKPIVTSIVPVEKVNEQGISARKLFYYLDDAYNKNILELTAQAKASKNNKKNKVFQKMPNFFQANEGKESIETEISNQPKFQV